MANILWNLVLYRREEEILVFLVLGKMLYGGHHAGGGRVLMAMLVGPLCQSLDNFGWHIPEAPVAQGNGLAMKGVLQFVHSSVATTRVKVESGRSRFAVVQLSSLSHHPVLASSRLKVPQSLNKSSKPWVRAR